MSSIINVSEYCYIITSSRQNYKLQYDLQIQSIIETPFDSRPIYSG